MDPSLRIIEIKINKWDLTKLENFCIAKETINKTKRQATGGEKIFANDVTNKGSISKVHKHLIQLSNQKTHTHTHKNNKKNGEKI